MLLTTIHDKKAKFAATGLRPARKKIKDLDFLRDLTEAGTLQPVVDRCYAPDQIAEAHRHVETGHRGLRRGDALSLYSTHIGEYVTLARATAAHPFIAGD